jgi:sugar phosphate isomerase/epimerase
MDIGNMYGAGGRALDLIKQYPVRFVSMHVKDEIKSSAGGGMDGYDSTVLGAGVLPVQEIVNTARKSGGTEYFIVEQESYQEKTPIESSRFDYEVMKKWGF